MPWFLIFTAYDLYGQSLITNQFVRNFYKLLGNMRISHNQLKSLNRTLPSQSRAPCITKAKNLHYILFWVLLFIDFILIWIIWRLTSFGFLHSTCLTSTQKYSRQMIGGDGWKDPSLRKFWPLACICTH